MRRTIWTLVVCAACAGEAVDTAPLDDLDQDGFTTEEGDCDDTDASVNPDAADTAVDGTDDDCDGFDGVDGDGDGVASQASGGHDCNDADASIYPGAEEVCDAQDNNCNGLVDEGLPFATYYIDSDSDGHGDSSVSVTDCAAPDGYVDNDTDCDDSTAAMNPGNTFDYCDGIDNDCDEQVDEDSKADWDLVTLQGSTAYRIDPSTAAASAIADVPYALDFNTADSRERGETFALGFNGETLHEYDICDETLDDIGSTGVVGGCGISFGPDSELYGLLPGTNELVTYDLNTGEATVIAALDIVVGFCGLTYDCTNDRLIGASSTEKSLFEIDLTSGETTEIAALDISFSGMGVDYDPQGRRVLLSNGTSLYGIDLATADVTKIGDFGLAGVNDLALMQTCD